MSDEKSQTKKTEVVALSCSNETGPKKPSVSQIVSRELEKLKKETEKKSLERFDAIRKFSDR